jgi:phage shock protein E
VKIRKKEKDMAGNNVREMIKAGAKIIDVRSPGEFADEAYPGAINIPLNTLSARLDEIGPKDKPIILYCASGARSAQAARLLKQAGFTNFINAGGIGDMPR